MGKHHKEDHKEDRLPVVVGPIHSIGSNLFKLESETCFAASTKGAGEGNPSQIWTHLKSRFCAIQKKKCVCWGGGCFVYTVQHRVCFELDLFVVRWPGWEGEGLHVGL